MIPVVIALHLFVTLVRLFDPDLQHHDNVAQQQSRFMAQPLSTRSLRENLWQGREPIRRLLHEAGVESKLTEARISQLPKWQHIVDLYGDGVIIVGKDECAKFREKVSPDLAILAVAGTSN